MAIRIDTLKTLDWLHGVIAFYYTQCVCVDICAYNLITSWYDWTVTSWFDNTNLLKLIWAAGSGTRWSNCSFPWFFPLITTKHTWNYWPSNYVRTLKARKKPQTGRKLRAWAMTTWWVPWVFFLSPTHPRPGFQRGLRSGTTNRPRQKNPSKACSLWPKDQERGSQTKPQWELQALCYSLEQ